MSGREYPREWFGVSSSEDIKTQSFIAETKHKLREPDRHGCKRYTNKRSDYRNWYPTREEAEVAVAEVKARNAFKNRARRIHNAAPELLEALRSMCDAYELVCADSGMYYPESKSSKYAYARALIAKIERIGQ